MAFKHKSRIGHRIFTGFLILTRIPIVRFFFFFLTDKGRNPYGFWKAVTQDFVSFKGKT